MLNAAVLHIGFLGMRRTALVSADDKGMAFSHLATRGMGVIARTIRTTRILGRYPDKVLDASRLQKPSSVLAFSPLPLGNAEHTSDSIGLVAMLTPYLLVIVSTTPIAQTQYKSPRPKEVAAHGAMSAALAWFPSVKLKSENNVIAEPSSRLKLVYCWSNILNVLEVIEVEPSEKSEKGATPSLQFRTRSRWKAEEAIVGLQWLSRSVLAVLTITQQLIILEDSSLQVSSSCDLIQKHIYHVDLFSKQLNPLVDQLDEEDATMHGVVADAFYMSFRAYKGRLFLLGYNEISFGTLPNWADRLLALIEQGDFIGAINLATSYYNGKADKVTVALPEDDLSRHQLVREKLLEMMSASLKYAFGKNLEAGTRRVKQVQLEMLAAACVTACISTTEYEYLFDNVYTWYEDGNVEGIFLETLEPHIMEGEVEVLPPLIIKNLIGHYMTKGFKAKLEEIICNLDPRTMDIDQITSLCKSNNLYDALLYVWNQALGDYTTLLSHLLDLVRQPNGVQQNAGRSEAVNIASASKIFPYLSYILTSRVYPTGREMPEDKALNAKAEIYDFFFSGNNDEHSTGATTSFPNLRKILDFDAPSFLSMLNEAFEDSFFDGTHNQSIEKQAGQLAEAQTFNVFGKRQMIVKTLLDLMTPARYEPEDTIYLDMFIARNLPKFPQFILLPGHVLHRVLIGLCHPPGNDFAEDCQLSVEYLLSTYQPPDMPLLIPSISEARFFRVLKSIYRAEKQYSKLLQTCFDDNANPEAIFECIEDLMRPGGVVLTDDQISDIRSVITSNAYNLMAADVTKAALTINKYMPDLHSILLEVLEADESSQFEYLRNVLEPSSQDSTGDQAPWHIPRRTFVERYVRLLCEFDPHHVSEYVEQLEAGDLRLEEVLPSLEQSSVIDAAVVLMAREGKIRQAIDRLAQHLRTLEAALLGLLHGASSSPDVSNTQEAIHDLVTSIQKYARVGVWICRGQTSLVQERKPKMKQPKRASLASEELSIDEDLWSELIDAVVAVTKNITEAIEESHATRGESDAFIPHESVSSSIEVPRLCTDLRTVVQETFTALLAATSVPRSKDARRTDVSFLRILRAFLNRASLSSPSLSNLRSVLATIFSAYAYEESLLSLANRLLDSDLFVHVAEVASLRRRGWRPLGQVCEGCGKRVWGPGTGGHIWDAWQRRNEERSQLREIEHATNGNTSKSSSPRKGKAAMGARNENPASNTGVTNRDRGKGIAAAAETEAETADATDTDGLSQELIIFACRHIFHLSCLEKMQGSSNQEMATGALGNAHLDHGPDFKCPLCPQQR